MNQNEHIVICAFLLGLHVELAHRLNCEKITTRELRISRVLLRPRAQRLIGEIYRRDNSPIGRRSARSNRVIAKGVVDTEVAHL